MRGWAQNTIDAMNRADRMARINGQIESRDWDAHGNYLGSVRDERVFCDDFYANDEGWDDE
jgi:hypothetical protein